jgi:hypothetical protein
MQLSSDQSDPNIDRPVKPELIARLSPFGLASTICPKAFATKEAGADTTEENLNPLRCFDFDLEIAVVASATSFRTIPRPTFGDNFANLDKAAQFPVCRVGNRWRRG